VQPRSPLTAFQLLERALNGQSREAGSAAVLARGSGWWPGEAEELYYRYGEEDRGDAD